MILSYWNYIDRRLVRRLLDAIMQGCNNWLNGLTAEEKSWAAGWKCWQARTRTRT